MMGGSACALVEFSFAVDEIQGDGWQAQGIGVELFEQSFERMALSVTLAQLDLPEGRGSVRGLRLECGQFVRDELGWRCDAGRLQMEDSPLQQQDAAWQGSYADDGRISLSIPQLALAGGTVALQVDARDGVWTVSARPYRARLVTLASLSGAPQPPRNWGIRGRLSGQVRLDGQGGELSGANADLVLDQLAYASPDGSQAAEKIVLKFALAARRKGAAWAFDADLGWPAGAVYAEPLFLDAAQGALALKASGSWSPAAPTLLLDSWTLDLAKTATVSGTGRFEGAGFDIKQLTIAVQSDDAGRLYERVLQPFLIGTAADDMTMSGRVGMALHFDDKGIEQAGLQLNRVTLDDRQGRFSLEGADGSVAWNRSEHLPVSQLDVRGAGLYRIPIGPFTGRAIFAGERIDLVEPIVVPVLGGAVALDKFALTGALMAGERPRWEASASVRGVSLEQLTGILEWPPFNGSLTGQLRNLRYADQLFSVGGGLELNAFDGNIVVDNLRIRDPFGTVPVLEADTTMRGLDLKALTQTFSFGRIEGRLDADMKNIRLVGWLPDRFDLHLYTPPGDDSRHRISQRAVENLTELGSGVPAGLSATFLSVFEEFRYDRIELKVLLDGNVAQLDGLARPDGGYYLVKGSGLPRIDVIGRNRSVAWKDLVERLRQIQVEGAQIR